MDPDQKNPLLMEHTPQTYAQLLECVGKLFHCMTGPPTAYFDIPLAERTEYHDRPVEPVFERLLYVTLAWRASGPRTAAVEAKLVMAMLEPFLEARRQLLEREATALLFWRRAIEIEEALETDHEGRPLGPRVSRIWCRVVIPGADLSHYARQEGELVKWL